MLQVLFLLLVTFSVARPALRRPGFMPGRAILIVDNSASMLSTEMGQTRLALAKQAALQHIQQVSAEGGMMLMLTSAPNPLISEKPSRPIQSKLQQRNKKYPAKPGTTQSPSRL